MNVKTKTFLIFQYSTLKSTVVLYNSWHTGLASSKRQGKVTDSGRSERRWDMVELKICEQLGDRGQAATSLMPDIDGMDTCVFKSLQLEGLYVGGLQY